jgi:membrane protease YdiL (CAAX protease family)
MTRLFYLDLAKGNASAATAAYRALRDLGWSADPVGRHRLALALVHPATRWELRDLGGVFGILLAILTALLLPAGVAIPVHYVGLVRRSRGASEESTRWKLRDAWIAGSLLILGSFLALYLFAYEDLATLLGSHVKANLSQRQLARVGIASFLSTGLTAALFARRNDWKRLAPAAWLTRTTFRTAGRFFALLLVAAWINRWLVSFFLPAPSAASSESLALSTLECLRAIGHVYGTLTLIIVAAGAVPLGEEFLFRGVLLDGLQRHISFRWANVIQAVLFALAHENLRMAPFLFTMGMLAGYLRRKTGSLTTGVVVHAVNNLVASLAIAAGVTPG